MGWLHKTFRKRRKAASTLPHVHIGRHSYGLNANMVVRPSATAPLTIGNFCSIGPNVLIFSEGEHPTNRVSTFPFRTLLWQRADGNTDATSKGGVTIGHDVWLGARCMILSGVTIGNGAVIGAGAVVSKDVPPYAVAVGNPARVVKYRFTPAQIDALQAIAWWDWPDTQLQQADPLLYGDIDAFIAAFAPPA